MHDNYHFVVSRVPMVEQFFSDDSFQGRSAYWMPLALKYALPVSRRESLSRGGELQMMLASFILGVIFGCSRVSDPHYSNHLKLRWRVLLACRSLVDGHIRLGWHLFKLKSCILPLLKTRSPVEFYRLSSPN